MSIVVEPKCRSELICMCSNSYLALSVFMISIVDCSRWVCFRMIKYGFELVNFVVFFVVDMRRYLLVEAGLFSVTNLQMKMHNALLLLVYFRFYSLLRWIKLLRFVICLLVDTWCSFRGKELCVDIVHKP